LRSTEAAQVAQWFGLGRRPRRRKRDEAPATASELKLVPSPGTITLIAGPSGAGKSSLLRRLRETRQSDSRVWIELEKIDPPELPVVNCFPGRRLISTLRLLGRVGLGEAWSYLRT